jgi:hypothetical protein
MEQHTTPRPHIPNKTQPGAIQRPGLAVGRSGRHTPTTTCPGYCYQATTGFPYGVRPRGFRAVSETSRSHIDARARRSVAPHQRFTRPSRETVIVALCDPRRSTILPFESPPAIPLDPNTITGLLTESATPCAEGPMARRHGPQAAPNVSVARVSARTTTRVRVPQVIARKRATATVVATSRAECSTAARSSQPRTRGRPIASRVPATAATTTSSGSDTPRRTAQIWGCPHGRRRCGRLRH